MKSWIGVLILTVVVVERLRVNIKKIRILLESTVTTKVRILHFFTVYFIIHISPSLIYIYMCTCTRSEYLILLVGVVILDIEVTNITLGNVI